MLANQNITTIYKQTCKSEELKLKLYELHTCTTNFGH